MFQSPSKGNITDRYGNTQMESQYQGERGKQISVPGQIELQKNTNKRNHQVISSRHREVNDFAPGQANVTKGTTSVLIHKTNFMLSQCHRLNKPLLTAPHKEENCPSQNHKSNFEVLNRGQHVPGQTHMYPQSSDTPTLELGMVAHA